MRVSQLLWGRAGPRSQDALQTEDGGAPGNSREEGRHTEETRVFPWHASS